MFKHVVYALRHLMIRAALEYWRWRMVRAEHDVMRLTYSQQCDLWIVRYHRLLNSRPTSARPLERVRTERVSNQY